MVPSQVKLSIKIDAWPFKSPTNRLRLVLCTTPTPEFDMPFSVSSDPMGVDLLTFTSTNVMTSQIRILRFADVDGVPQPISYFVVTVAGITNFFITFPRFNNTLLYDPDFGVSLIPANGNQGDGDGAELKYIALVSLAIVPLVMLIIGGLIFGIMIWKRKQLINRLTSALHQLDK